MTQHGSNKKAQHADNRENKTGAVAATSGYDLQGGQSRDFHEENARNRETREGNVLGHPGSPPSPLQAHDVESHAGQVGYGLSGGEHEDWGAFDRDQERQSPGYGQQEPWQKPLHPHDADTQGKAGAASESRKQAEKHK